MAKYILDFPEKRAFVKASVSPMQIRELAGQYVDRQSDAFGTICLVRLEDNSDISACTIIGIAVEGGEFFVKESPISLPDLSEEVRM